MTVGAGLPLRAALWLEMGGAGRSVCWRNGRSRRGLGLPPLPGGTGTPLGAAWPLGNNWLCVGTVLVILAWGTCHLHGGGRGQDAARQPQSSGRACATLALSVRDGAQAVRATASSAPSLVECGTRACSSGAGTAAPQEMPTGAFGGPRVSAHSNCLDTVSPQSRAGTRWGRWWVWFHRTSHASGAFSQPAVLGGP